MTQDVERAEKKTEDVEEPSVSSSYQVASREATWYEILIAVEIRPATGGLARCLRILPI